MNIPILLLILVLFVRVRLWKSSTWNTLVSPATIVTLIGRRELLVRIVTSIGWEVPGMRRSSNVLLWLLVESSKAVLVVLAGTLKFKAVFEPVIVWVSIKQLSF